MLGRLRRRAMLGIAIGLTAAALVVPTMIAPPAYAESGSQSDPADRLRSRWRRGQRAAGLLNARP